MTMEGTGTKKSSGGAFQSMNLLPSIYKSIQKKGYRLPTPIQRKCIPPLMEGRDVVGMARTGSGKTAAFIIPLLQKLKSHSPIVGARALVMAPSRELAMQTFSVLRDLAKGLDLRSVVLVGGDGLDEQFSKLATNPDIIVATPGRLMHILVESKLAMRQVEYVVWDEADRLMEDPVMAEQMKEISARLPAKRQTALFSATLPKALADFAQASLEDPLLVRLDVDSKLSPDLRLVHLYTQPNSKLSLLLLLLDRINEGDVTRGKRGDGKQSKDKNKEKYSKKTVIFAATKHHVEFLQELLKSLGYPCCYIYGSLDQTARKMAIEEFRRGACPILIVTDVAARGIDIPLLDNVINFDFPAAPKLFVHRVGRVARAGRTGSAFSLLTADDMPFLFDLTLFLNSANELKSVNEHILGAKREQKSAVSENGLLGMAPQHMIDGEDERIVSKLDISATLSDMQRVMNNASKMYRKSKSAPSPESFNRWKEFMASKHPFGIHPIFIADREEARKICEQESLLNTLQNFKPKASHLQKSLGGLGQTLSLPNKSNKTSTLAPNGGTNTANPSTSTATAEEARKKNEYYLQYQRPVDHDTAGYAIKGSFAEEARNAIFDLSSTKLNHEEQPSDNRNKRRKQEERQQRNKLVSTDVGSKVKSSYKSDAYEKWKKKTHLELQQPGEQETLQSSSRARSLIHSHAEKKKWRGSKKRKPKQK